MIKGLFRKPDVATASSEAETAQIVKEVEQKTQVELDKELGIIRGEEPALKYLADCSPDQTQARLDYFLDLIGIPSSQEISTLIPGSEETIKMATGNRLIYLNGLIDPIRKLVEEHHTRLSRENGSLHFGGSEYFGHALTEGDQRHSCPYREENCQYYPATSELAASRCLRDNEEQPCPPFSHEAGTRPDICHLCRNYIEYG